MAFNSPLDSSVGLGGTANHWRSIFNSMNSLTSFPVPWIQTRKQRRILLVLSSPVSWYKTIRSSMSLISLLLLIQLFGEKSRTLLRTFCSPPPPWGDPLTLNDAVGVDFRFTCLSSFPIFEVSCNASNSHSNWPDGCIYSKHQTQIVRRIEKGIAKWRELRSITCPFFFSAQVVAELEEIHFVFWKSTFHILERRDLYLGQIHVHTLILFFPFGCPASE